MSTHVVANTMQSLVLASLIDVPITLTVSSKDNSAFRPGARFDLAVELVNNGERALAWSQQNPLNLAYRWLTEEGEPVERDGLRTALPTSLLPPGGRVAVALEGTAPEDEGCYQLQLSLVLEGTHWACDVGTNGWVQRVTNVTPAPAWPIVLQNSRGGRALRGAMVAAELARHLESRTFEDLMPPEPTTATSSGSSLADEPRPRLHPLRDWLRTLLGVRGLEQQLVEVIALANSQEQRGRELETQILELKEGFQADSKSFGIQAKSTRDLTTGVHHDGNTKPSPWELARDTATIRSLPDVAPSKKPSKRSKTGRKKAL